MGKQNSKNDAQEEPERDDPWFNPYRETANFEADIALRTLVYDFGKQENRKRIRKPKDKEWLWQVGYALLADLTYHHLSGKPGTGLIVPRAKRELGKTSRYHPPYYTRTFPDLLDALEEFGLLVQTKGEFSGMPGQSRRTTIRAGAKLIALIEEHRLTFNDLGLGDDEEVIILKAAKRGPWDRGDRIEYEDSVTTRRLRAEVREINGWLRAANITFNSDANDKAVDTRERRLYRYFANEDFRSGGRLFRGFWQNLSKTARLHGLRVDGERIVELDYAQLNPTLAYARVGCAPPPGDAYTLPGLEDHREGVKKAFNALLFDRGPRKSFPKGVKDLFPAKAKIGHVIAAIREKHPMLRSVLSTGAGFELMYRESEIMMGVLKRLKEAGVIGLPVFDAVLVKASKADVARAVMKKEFKDHTGLEIEVRLMREPLSEQAPIDVGVVQEPAPEVALDAGDLHEARSKLLEVLRAKPVTYDDL